MIAHERNREPVQALVPPGEAPTHDDPQGGQRWHYLTLAGERTDPPTYMYQDQEGAWWGEVDNHIFPDGHSPKGPATREHIEQRIEAYLLQRGVYLCREQVPSARERKDILRSVNHLHDLANPWKLLERTRPSSREENLAAFVWVNLWASTLPATGELHYYLTTKYTELTPYLPEPVGGAYARNYYAALRYAAGNAGILHIVQEILYAFAQRQLEETGILLGMRRKLPVPEQPEPVCASEPETPATGE